TITRSANFGFFQSNSFLPGSTVHVSSAGGSSSLAPFFLIAGFLAGRPSGVSPAIGLPVTLSVIGVLFSRLNRTTSPDEYSPLGNLLSSSEYDKTRFSRQALSQSPFMSADTSRS